MANLDSSAVWYLARGGKTVGPFTVQQLKQFWEKGTLHPTDIVHNQSRDKSFKIEQLESTLFKLDEGTDRAPAESESEAKRIQGVTRPSGNSWTGTRKSLAITAIAVFVASLSAVVWLLWPAAEQPEPELNIEQQVAELELRKTRLMPLLAQAEEDKSALVEKLKALGITNPAEIKGHTSAQRLAKSIQLSVNDIRTIQGEIDRIEEGIFHLRTQQRRMEQRALGISDETLSTLTVSTEATDPISPLTNDPVSLEALIAEELGFAKQSPSGTAPPSTMDRSTVAISSSTPTIPDAVTGGASNTAAASANQTAASSVRSDNDLSGQAVYASGNVALKSRGASITGFTKGDPNIVIDGKTEDVNDVAKAPLNSPIILRLSQLYYLSTVRLYLVPLGLPRPEYSHLKPVDSFYRYTVEVSKDGTNYEFVARNYGMHRDRQTVTFGSRPVKYIRIVGVYDYPAQTGLRLAEVEAYCDSALPD